MVNLRIWLAALLLVMTVAPAAPAAAQGAQGKRDEELAKQFYRLGEELYNRSDYEGALKQFQQSYQYSKRPGLLYNMARCYESLAKLEDAVKYYQEFLKSKPSDAAVIEARIENLKARLEASRPVQPPPLAVPPPVQPQGGQPQTGQPQASAPLPQPPPPEPPAPGRTKRIAGWTLAGVGVAGLVVGAIFGARAKKLSTEVEDAGADGTAEFADFGDKWDKGQSSEKAGIACLVIGGAAAVSGAVLLYFGYREKRAEQRAWLSPTITPGGAMLAGSWSF